jgi:proline iminopeptidase
VTNGALRTALCSEIEPYASGMLPLDAIHAMYWETSGRPQGIPVVFLHGGPGSGSTPKHRRFFDPEASRSSSTASAARNRRRSASCARTRRRTSSPTSSAARIARHRALAGVRRPWARRSPSRTRAPSDRCLVSSGIFLCRKSEIDWFLYGLRAIFPEPWERFAGFLPPGERGDLLGNYFRRLVDPDPAVHMPAARAWSVYEGSCSTLLPSRETVDYFAGDVVALGLARMEAHYFRHDIFLPENALLANAGRLRGIPGVIVQGRYDVVCPIVSAHELAAAWPEADYQVVPDAGHSAWEPGISAALVAACERFKVRLR